MNRDIIWLSADQARMFERLIGELRMPTGGSHGNRKTAQALQSRAVGAAKAPADKRAQQKTTASSLEASRESSGLAPDYIDLRKGYRGWFGYLRIRGVDYAKNWTKNTPLPRSLSSIRPNLCSLSIMSTWRPKVVKRAHCTCDARYRGIANGAIHTCGIYAYKRMFTTYVESYEVSSNVLRTRGIVVLQIRVNGSVWMWGDIIEHANGYRAEYAFPCAFLVPPKGKASLLYERALRMLARLYGVDVVSKPEEL